MKFRFGCFAAFAVLSACTEIKVPPPPEAPRVLSFTADRTQVARGVLVTLSFTTQNATEVQLLDDSGHALELSGTVEAGSAQVAPTRSTFYVARVQGAGGRDSAFVQIAVGEPLKELFLLAVPSTLESGETGQLLWGAPGASRVTLSAGNDSPQVLTGTTGTVNVTPARSEHYELRASIGTSTPLTALAEVRVSPKLVSANLDTPNGLTAGEAVTLRWTTRGAQRVTVREQSFGQLTEVTTPAEVDDGSFTWTVPATLPTGLPVQDGVPLEFIVTVSSNAGELSQQLVGVVGDAPVIERLTAPSAASVGRTFSITWNTLNAVKVGVEVGGHLVFETQPNELARAAAGSVQLPAPATQTTYSVVATNARGVAVQQSVTVRPAQLPVITSFTLTPNTIAAAGDMVTAQWSSTNANRLQLRLENGGTFAIDSTHLNSGTLTFAAGSTQRITLEAYNEAEERVTASAGLQLTGTPRVAISPSPMLKNASTTLTWDLASLPINEVVGLPTPRPAAITGSSRFVDLSTRSTSTELLFADRANGSSEVRLPLGFRFPFLGVPRSSLWISVNGFIAIAPPAALTANLDLTAASVPTMIAPYWDDLALNSATAKILTGFGPTTADGERVFIIQWNDVQRVGAVGSSLTFQVQLTEAGEVAFIYQTLTGGEVTGESQTVGVKEATQAVAQRFSFNSVSPSLSEGLELRFFTGAPVTSTVQLFADTSKTVTFFGRTGAGLVPLSIPLVALGPGDVLVSEAMPFPHSTIAATGQWIELRNTLDVPIDLDGAKLESTGSVDGGFVFSSGSVIPAMGTLVVGQTVSSPLNGGAGVTVVANDLPLDIGHDRVTLFLDDEPISSLTWTSSVEARSAQLPEGMIGQSNGVFPSCNGGTRTFGTTGSFGTPGQANDCVAYRAEPIDGGFVDLTGSITTVELLPNEDDQVGVGTVQLPHPFVYFGEEFTELNLTMAGFFTFGTPMTQLSSPHTGYLLTNEVMPTASTPNGTVAPFWDDLVRGTNGKILLRRDADRTIVSFQDFRFYAATTSSVNFQVHLFDSGVIEFHYGAFTLPTAALLARGNGSTATVWLETPSGGSAVSVGANTAGALQQNSGLRFTP
jgi:hypothetical protein